MANVGTLNIVLKASTEGLSKGLNEADKGLAGVKSSAGGASSGLAALGGPAGIAAAAVAAVGVAALAAGAGLAALVMKTAEFGDEIDKTSQKLGIGSDALQELRHAAGQSGASVSTLDRALAKSNVNAARAAKGTGAAAESFKTLGINVQNADGSLKSSDVLLTEVSANLHKAGSEAAKAALLTEIYGRSGAELLPLLNAGAEGIQGLRDEAQGLNMVLGSQGVKDSANFQDAMARVQGLIEGTARAFASNFLPAATMVLDAIRDFAVAFKDTLPGAEGLREGLLSLTKDGLERLRGALLSANDGFIQMIGSLKKGAPFISAIAKTGLGVYKALSLVMSATKLVQSAMLALVGGAVTVLVKGLVAVQEAAISVSRWLGMDGLADAMQKSADVGKAFGNMLEDMTNGAIENTADAAVGLYGDITTLGDGFDTLSTQNITGVLNSVETGALASKKALEGLNIALASTANYEGNFFAPSVPEPETFLPKGYVAPKAEEDEKKKPAASAKKKSQEEMNALFKAEMEILKETDSVKKAQLKLAKTEMELKQDGITGAQAELALLKDQLKVKEAQKAVEDAAAEKAAARYQAEAQAETDSAVSEAEFGLLNIMMQKDELGQAELERKILMSEIAIGMYGQEEAMFLLAQNKLKVEDAIEKSKDKQAKKDAKAIADQRELMNLVGGTLGKMGDLLGVSFDIGSAWNATIGIMDGVKAAIAATGAIATATGILGIIGAAASLFSVFSSAGASDKPVKAEVPRKAFDRGESLKDQAKEFAKAFADEQEKRLGRPVEINIDARGALTGEANEVARKLTDLVQGEMAMRVGGIRG